MTCSATPETLEQAFGSGLANRSVFSHVHVRIWICPKEPARP